MSFNTSSCWEITGLLVRAKQLLVAVVVISVASVAAGFYYREKATASGFEDQASWSSTGQCVVKTYVRDFSGLGMAGRFFGLFSATYYYRVYSKNGDLLKTSEWNLAESEAGDVDHARWVYGHVLYPTANGYGGWALRGCNG